MQQSTIPNIEQLRQELSEIESALQVNTEPQKLADLGRKHAKLSKLIDLDTHISTLSKQLEETTLLLADESLAELAQQELPEISSKLASAQQQLSELTQIELPDDEKKCMIELRAGTGGAEAALFAEDLMRMYTRYCTKQGWQVELIEEARESSGGIKYATLKVNADESYGRLRFESGVHRVQRVPATEAAGRIHTSAASVVVLPQIEDVSVIIKDTDIRVDVYRSSGPGGQSVNTTDSAVRITHIPTNIVITCQDGKSQLKNKQRALEILASKLYDLELQKQMEAYDQERKISIKSGDRSVKIRTYNFPQSRVTDHRVKQTWYNIDTIMDGDIEEILSTIQQEMRR